MMKLISKLLLLTLFVSGVLPVSAQPAPLKKKWMPLLDEGLTRWEKFIGVPHTSLALEGYPKGDGMKGTPLAGKKAISMDVAKYSTMKGAILSCLQSSGEITHTELLQAVKSNLIENKTEFEGSVGWHMEWVKMDLEAKKEIRRVGDKPPIRFAVA